MRKSTENNVCFNFMQNLFQTLFILTTLSKLHFSSASSGQRNSCRPTCQSIFQCSRFKSSGLLCYANQSTLTIIFSIKQSKKKVTTEATVLSSILTTWTGKMALFGKGHWNLWFNRWACRKSLLMAFYKATNCLIGLSEICTPHFQGYKLLNRPLQSKRHAPS
jgi:hypothetical protein